MKRRRGTVKLVHYCNVWCFFLFCLCRGFTAQSTIGIMSSAVSLPNHTLSRDGLVLDVLNQYFCTFFYQKLTTALLESAEWRAISWSVSTKECCQTRRGSNPRLLDLQSDTHPTKPPRPANTFWDQRSGLKPGVMGAEPLFLVQF